MAPAQIEPPTQLASQRTLALLLSALEQSATAGLADVAKLVQMLSSEAADISIHQLSDIIEKDAIVSAKCIAAANKLGFNTHGVDITTIPQAIQVVGFNKIRSLAVSFLLLQNAVALNLPEPRHNTKVCLLAGMLSRAWAQANERPDPDRHFLAGSLKNFGKLLVVTHCLEAYREAIAPQPPGSAPDAGWKLKFGLGPSEITHRLMERIALPGSILKALSPFPPENAHRPPANEVDEIAVVSEFFVRFCELVLEANSKAPEYHAATVALLNQFSALQLTREALDGLLEQVEKLLRFYGEGTYLAGVASQITQQIAQRRAPYVPPKPAPAEAAPTPKSAPTATPAEPMTIQLAIASIADELPKPLFRLDRVIALAAAGLADPWNAQVIALFSGHAGTFRYLAPPNAALAKVKPTGFRLSEPHLLGLSAVRGEPLAISDLTEAKYQPVLPPWFAEGSLKSCLILPNGAREKCSFVALIGWTDSQKVTMNAEQVRDHRTLFSLVCAAQRLTSLQ